MKKDTFNILICTARGEYFPKYGRTAHGGQWTHDSEQSNDRSEKQTTQMETTFAKDSDDQGKTENDQHLGGKTKKGD